MERKGASSLTLTVCTNTEQACAALEVCLCLDLVAHRLMQIFIGAVEIRTIEAHC